MVKRMLIDATHAEETRVVVLDGNRLEEFDFETSTKKQIKGNIYLAKVTRVEPSLQAAFVEYGGNRHGFLSFSEIHPDYYRIPQADRDALMRETLEQQREYDRLSESAQGQEDETVLDGELAPDGGQPEDGGSIVETAEEPAEEPMETVEALGGDDFEDASPRRRFYRNYKIQDVIARRQILLVQVAKEERGNKGAALTTYLSLAGRYCVLMPNTPRGGGVSRKITSLADRKRLKTILDDLELPEGVGMIMRTAGLDRPRAEIHRDYEYLLRLWNEIRETTLASSAPTLIHEEGNLIKRAIRDLYSRDIDEVWVEGEEGYRTAKSFMRTIIPSRVKQVLPYRDPAIPLMNRFQVEAQLDAIHNPAVQLRSGGYIIINPTEALVAIDVNSGRATKERHIEETACKTNLEAAEEIARQVRLRDLAGLIVIDFIDMEEHRNNHTVERRLKEAMKDDRARIQIGRISPFGLLELSRQRLRPSLIEASTEKCPHCNGSGVIRSTESAALHVLRAIEDEGIRGRTLELLIYAPTNIALYILNQKRDKLADIEQRYSFSVQIDRDDGLIQPDHRIERLRLRAPGELPAFMTAAALPPQAADEDYDEERDAEESDAEESDDVDGDHRRAKRRRRRGRRRRDGAPAAEMVVGDKLPDDGDSGGVEIVAIDAEEARDSDALSLDELGDDDRDRRRRRRGRRGGRRRLRDDGDGAQETLALLDGPDPAAPRPDTGMAGDNLAIDALPVPLAVAADPHATPQPMPILEAAESAVASPPVTDALAVEATSPGDPLAVSVDESAAAEPPPAKAKRAVSRKKTPRPASDAQTTAPMLSDKAEEAAPKPKKRSSTRRSAAKSEPLAAAASDPPSHSAAPESAAPESAPVFLPAMTVTVIDEPPPRRRAGWWQRN